MMVSCSKKQDKILPEQKNLVESVYSSVTIQPDSLYEVYAVVSGILDKNLGTEGDLISILMCGINVYELYRRRESVIDIEEKNVYELYLSLQRVIDIECVCVIFPMGLYGPIGPT